MNTGLSKTPDIKFEVCEIGGYTCYDRNLYDGAEDSGARALALGHGATKAEALADYIEKLEGINE